jgi:heat shock protein HtpX
MQDITNDQAEDTPPASDIRPHTPEQESIVGTVILSALAISFSYATIALFSVVAVTMVTLGMGMGIAATAAVIGAFVVPFMFIAAVMRGINATPDEAIRYFKAQRVPDSEYLAVRVAETARAAGLEKAPATYIIPNSQMLNALATGSPNNSAVLLTQRLILELDQRAIDAIIGHEVGHIANKDITRLHILKNVENTFGFLFRLLPSPPFLRWTLMFANFMQTRALSRGREYRADRAGAALTSPDAMISALAALADDRGKDRQLLKNYSAAAISAPLASFGAIFSTHPPIRSRIAALQRGTR